jgi:hypothetical protein
LEFYDTTASLVGTIAANGSNLKISSVGGIIELGNTATDVQVGTIGTSINWSFLGGATIGAGGLNTINMGQSGDTLNMNVSGVNYQYPSTLVRYTDITATNNKINITTQVPGSINLSLPNRPVVGQLSLTDNAALTSTSTGALNVVGTAYFDNEIAANNGIIFKADTRDFVGGLQPRIAWRRYNYPQGAPLDSGAMTANLRSYGTFAAAGTFANVSITTMSFGLPSYICEVAGYLYANTSGLYTFGVNSDDNSDLFIDGKLVADWFVASGHGANSSGTPGGNQRTIYLNQGYHRLYGRWQQGGGQDSYELLWKNPGDVSYSIIPIGQLYHHPTDFIMSSGDNILLTQITQISNTVNIAGNLVVSYTGGSGNQNTVAVLIGANTKGGTGYNDFLSTTNLSAGATNPNKFFRLDSTGQLQIINSAYSANIFNLSDAGTLTIPNLTLPTGGGGIITFSDGTTQSTAAGGAATDQVARNFANSASSYANSAFLAANSAGSYANSAFAAANTPLTAGTYGGSSAIPVVVVAANGRISSIANTSISIPAGTSVYGNTGQITANAATGTVALGLATTTATVGTFGGTTQIPVISVDTYGRITSSANVSFSSGGLTISDDTTTNANRYVTLSTVTTGSLSVANTSSSKLYFNPSTGTLNSTVFNSLSDENKKTNIQIISNGLEIIENLNGVTFDWADNGIPSAGLLAQQVEKFLPQLVEYDQETNAKSLNYNGIIGVLVEAVKTLSKRVKELEKLRD